MTPDLEALVARLENDIRETWDGKHPGDLARRLIQRGWLHAAALTAAEARADALAEAIRLDASEDVPLAGTNLLRLVAALFDKRDDETGNANRTVQADLRRWADRIDAALAAHDARRQPK